MSRRGLTPGKPLRGALARGSYQSAEAAERRAVIRDGSGDFHGDPRSRELSRRLSRAADRNAAVYAGPISVALGLLLGDGAWPKPRFTGPDADELSAAFVADAKDPARHPFDLDGRLPLSELLWLFGRAYFRDGEALAYTGIPGKARLIESDRLVDVKREGRRIVDGVELSDGAEVAYWVANYSDTGQVDRRTALRVPADQAVFTAYRDRISSTRGVSPIGVSLDTLDQVDRMGDAEVKTAAQGARLLGFLESTGTAGGKPGQPTPKAPATIETDSAMLIGVPEGYKANLQTTSRPNLNVPAFRLQEMRLAFLVLGIPLELLTQDLNGLNFAASRSLRKLAEAALGLWRCRIFGAFLARVVRGWLTARGEDPERAVEWEWPRLDLHDRNKEATADRDELTNRTTSRRRLVGPDRLAVLDELAEEERHLDALNIRRVEEAQRLCEAVNERMPKADLHWSKVLTLAGAASAPGAYLQAAAPAPDATPTTDTPAAP